VVDRDHVSVHHTTGGDHHAAARGEHRRSCRAREIHAAMAGAIWVGRCVERPDDLVRWG
jgi:hypothetical protein